MGNHHSTPSSDKSSSEPKNINVIEHSHTTPASMASESSRPFKKAKKIAATTKQDYTTRQETIYDYEGDIIFNYGRLHAHLRNQKQCDEVLVRIRPHPSIAGAKAVELKAQIDMSEGFTSEDDGADELVTATVQSERSSSQSQSSSRTVETSSVKKVSGQKTKSQRNPPKGRDPAPEAARSEEVDQSMAALDTAVCSTLPEIERDSDEDAEVGSFTEEYASDGDAQEEAEPTQADIGDPAQAQMKPGPAPSYQRALQLTQAFIDPQKPAIGLPSAGKTSYRTVCIQAIAHSRHMRQYLQDTTLWLPGGRPIGRQISKMRAGQANAETVGENAKHAKNDPETISSSLRKVAGVIWGESDDKLSDQEIKAFNKMVQRKYELDTKNAPEDPYEWKNNTSVATSAGEAMDWLLKELKQDHNNVFPYLPRDKTFTTSVGNRSFCAYDECPGKHVSDRQSHLTLKLNVETHHKTVKNALDAAFNSAHQFPSSYSINKGHKCKKNGNKIEKRDIADLADVLFIELGAEHEINLRNLICDQQLSVAPYLRTDQDPGIYDLIGIISYKGVNKKSGHHIIHALGPSGVCRLDDNYAEQLDGQNMPEARALTDRLGERTTPSMLVYERRASASTNAQHTQSSSQALPKPSQDAGPATKHIKSSRSPHRQIREETPAWNTKGDKAGHNHLLERHQH